MVSLFLLATFSLAFLSSCQADLISSVCSEANNPPLCTQALTSDQRSRGADFRGLGQIIIKKAKTATKATINAAKSVRPGGRNKQIVKICVEVCGYAIDDLNLCSQLLKKSDKQSIGDLKVRGSGASTNVWTCDDEFGGSEPDKVKKAIRTTSDLIDVLLVIADRL